LGRKFDAASRRHWPSVAGASRSSDSAKALRSKLPIHHPNGMTLAASIQMHREGRGHVRDVDHSAHRPTAAAPAAPRLRSSTARSVRSCRKPTVGHFSTGLDNGLDRRSAVALARPADFWMVAIANSRPVGCVRPGPAASPTRIRTLTTAKQACDKKPTVSRSSPRRSETGVQSCGPWKETRSGAGPACRSCSDCEASCPARRSTACRQRRTPSTRPEMLRGVLEQAAGDQCVDRLGTAPGRSDKRRTAATSCRDCSLPANSQRPATHTTVRLPCSATPGSLT
jgi:hypothetical protein